MQCVSMCYQAAGCRVLRCSHLSRADVFSAAQPQDFLEGESKCCSSQAGGGAVVYGPHESKRPGTGKLREKYSTNQRQAEQQLLL